MAETASFTRDRRFATLLLMLLLIGDGGLLLLHVLNPVVFKSPMLSIARDGSYPEFYQYMKFFWLIALMAAVYARTRTAGYLGWTLLFVYFLADDAVQIHETWGRVVASRIAFEPPFGLLAQDLGELSVNALAGGVIFPLLALSVLKSDAACRAVSRQLLVLLAALIFFGVAFDVLHSAMKVYASRVLDFAFATLEDGGEMLVTSVMLWYVAAVYGALHTPAVVRATALVRHFARDRRRSARRPVGVQPVAEPLAP